ncbi:MAG: fused MFS/spermidine synthase [Candidatus Omnitrophica bacterium]|nr:fused MFS/spermidine synthase [Candidatus Omnitrophota bacterium]
MRLLFVATSFLSAFLLFSIQPMFAKMVLPRLGGTPAVWNTCMVFFQAALLAGYGYVHLATRALGVRRQAAAHVGVLLLPLLTLPIRMPAAWVPPTEANPIPSLLGLMVVVVGLPFVVVSTSAPLLQKWFANTADPAANDPYFLYAASNLGSLLALLGYPMLIEPHLRLATQSRAWGIGYASLVALTSFCAMVVWRSSKAAGQAPLDATAAVTPLRASRANQVDPVSSSRRLRWVLLSCAPSSLMLGVTTYLSTDIAAVPLLWVIPLALYLLTFVLVFSRRSLIPHGLMVLALPAVILAVVIFIVAQKTTPARVLLPLHLLMFFVAAMVCHGELAKDRPPPEHLTEFYLWLSVGGVLGGAFNALVAPLIFDTVLEYPLAMMLACLLRPGAASDATKPRHRWLDYAMPMAVGLWVASFALALRVSGIESRLVRLGLWCIPPALLCYAFRSRPIRFGLGIGAFLFVGILMTEGWEYTLHVERSFFGVYRVLSIPSPGGPYHKLQHGTTLHGMQSFHPARRREPLTYFDRSGPIGDVFDSFSGETPRLRRVAAIGLGTGTISCYASPGQQWTFYEIDPLVKRLATTPQYFTYLRDCLETFNVVLGDARLSLRRAPEKFYDLILLDAFSSDAIPMHLLTREALQLYLSKLADGGLVVFHISNRHLKLERVLGALAEAEDLVCLGRSDTKLSTAEEDRGKAASHWVAIARTREDLGALARNGSHWQRVSAQPGVAAWTDDFSNILSVFHGR